MIKRNSTRFCIDVNYKARHWYFLSLCKWISLREYPIKVFCLRSLTDRVSGHSDRSLNTGFAGSGRINSNNPEDILIAVNESSGLHLHFIHWLFVHLDPCSVHKSGSSGSGFGGNNFASFHNVSLDRRASVCLGGVPAYSYAGLCCRSNPRVKRRRRRIWKTIYLYGGVEKLKVTSKCDIRTSLQRLQKYVTGKMHFYFQKSTTDCGKT